MIELLLRLFGLAILEQAVHHVLLGCLSNLYIALGAATAKLTFHDGVLRLVVKAVLFYMRLLDAFLKADVSVTGRPPDFSLALGTDHRFEV